MNIIVSVAFRPVYLKHSTNQLRYLEGFDTLYFHDELPMKDCIHTDNIVGEFQKSLYGFKPHAIQRAIDKGATKVIWFDPSVLPTSSPKILFDALDEYPVLVRNNDGYLDKMANKKAKDYLLAILRLQRLRVREVLFMGLTLITLKLWKFLTHGNKLRKMGSSEHKMLSWLVIGQMKPV